MSNECLSILKSLNINPNKPIEHAAWLKNDDNKLLSTYDDVKKCLTSKTKTQKTNLKNVNVSQQCQQIYDKYNLDPNNNKIIMNWLIQNRNISDHKLVNECHKNFLGIRSEDAGSELKNKLNIYINNLKQLINSIEKSGVSTIFDCNKQNYGINVSGSRLVYGKDTKKVILIVDNEKDIKITIKFWFSQSSNYDKDMRNPKEFYIYNILRSDPEYKTKFRHMEILYTAGQCDNTIEYIQNILDMKCSNEEYVCKKTIREDIKLGNYNRSVKYGISRYADVGNAHTLFGPSGSAGILKYGNILFDINKEPLWLMSIILQLLWQVHELSEIGIVVQDLHVENVLIYYDLNFDSNNIKYYNYKINGNEFCVKVQPIVFKIIDYGLFITDIPINQAHTENSKQVSTFFSINVGIGSIVENINKNNQNIFDGPNGNSLFSYIRKSQKVIDPVLYYLNKVNNIADKNGNYVITDSSKITKNQIINMDDSSN